MSAALAIEDVVARAPRVVFREMARAGVHFCEFDEVLGDALDAWWRIDAKRFDPAFGSFETFFAIRVRWIVLDMRRRYVRRRVDYVGLARDVDLVAGDTYWHHDRLDHEAIWARARREIAAARSFRAVREVLRGGPQLELVAVMGTFVRGHRSKDVAAVLGLSGTSISRARDRGLARCADKLKALGRCWRDAA